MPNDLHINLKNWFDNKVKTNGFDGKLILNILNYKESISNLKNAKKIETTLNFSLNIFKDQENAKKTISGQIKSFGEIEGDFSLDDFDIIINKTKLDLIKRLAKELK